MRVFARIGYDGSFEADMTVSVEGYIGKREGSPRDRRPPDRRVLGREMDRDRARCGSHAASRRDARADRSVRGREVDDRAGGHGIRPGRLPHIRGIGRVRRDGTDNHLGGRPSLTAGIAYRLCRPVRRSLVQSRSQAHRSAHRSAGPLPQTQAPGEPGRRDAGLRTFAASQSQGDRVPVSPPGLGRPAAMGDDDDGDGVPARSHHLRRGDERARSTCWPRESSSCSTASRTS